MAKILYVPKAFYGKSQGRIKTADAILTEYQSQGLVLTLRQLYYQFVARGLLENSMANYKQLQQLVNDARLAGLLDWSAMEDRTRNLETTPTWDDPASILRSAAYGYKEDLWQNQPVYVEVWVEKDALVGVVERACKEYRVPFFSCRGYTSQSEVWSAAMRFKAEDKPVHIIHLGDHDPSGCDMSRDIEDRLCVTFGCRRVTLNRIALNMDQIRRYNPPPNPAKLTDSRCAAYMEKHGDESWELDALEPKVLHKLIVDTVRGYIDFEAWDVDERVENMHKAELQMVSDRYGEAIDHLHAETARLDALDAASHEDAYGRGPSTWEDWSI